MLKTRQMFGKYRIERRLATGGFASVYQALDTIEGLHVALKVLNPQPINDRTMKAFRNEVRLAVRLAHENILPIKDASIIEDRLVIVSPLGESTLAERWQRRISVETRLSYIQQMLEAVAHAHERKVAHCDIKPENMILFSGNLLRLADFGIARVALRTLHASGSGTVGYMAPEQAMGRPSLRSDVFALGLLIYRLLAGELPEWPFDWPLPGHRRLTRNVTPEFVAFLRKSLEIDPRRRYPDAVRMLAAFKAVLVSLRRHRRRVVKPASRTTQKRRAVSVRRRRSIARAVAR